LIWQDYVLAIGNWLFAIALIPTIIGKDKPAFSTSIMTSVILTIFAFCYFSLGLKWGAMAMGFGALAWWILTIQRLMK